MQLSDVIDQSPGLSLIRGVVLRITGDTFTMSYLGSEVNQISHLDQYTPAVDDIALVLVWPRGGMIALGSNNGTGAAPPTVTYPPSVTTVVAQGASTYQAPPSAPAWAGGVLLQAPDKAACWFYDTADFTPAAGSQLAAFEVEVTGTSGGPVELLLHANPGPSGALVRAVDTTFLPPVTLVAGVPTWIAAPTGWGELLASGQASGVGIGLGQHTGVYAGTGRLRFTSI